MTREGDQLIGNTARQIVEDLRVNSRSPGRDLIHFMEIIATNARTQSGWTIRTSTAEAFLGDLVSAGLLTRV